MNSKLRKNEKILMKQTLTENGITLIALVVTIVVLLILASVSITAVFGDNGLLQLAREAADKTNEAVKNDLQGIQNLTTDLDDIINPPVDISEIKGKVTENTKAVDKYGNKITIPAGFEIVPNGTDYVEYNYDTNEEGAQTHIPTVQDGIVIKDDENYFVWIPVGTIKNKLNDEKEESSEIILGRYDFDIGEYDENSNTYTGTGTANLKQSALNYKDISENTGTEGHQYQELVDTKYENAVAKSLSTFITETNKRGGYYIARYEAVKGNDEKAKSKPSTVDSATNHDQEIKVGMVYSNITQLDASTKSQKMYDNNNFETDLINSYAWDTAIVFIQTYSNSSTYSKQNSKNKTMGKTGERDEGTPEYSADDTTDKVCNIYDMASNSMEWSTETFTIAGYNPGVCRGGSFNDMRFRAGGRNGNMEISTKSYNISFRPILYIKNSR